jgi:membrane protease YdiL (CAAX protease family)
MLQRSKYPTAGRELALFFGLTYLVSWLSWGAAAVSGQDVTASPWLAAHTLGGLTPSLVGVALFYRLHRSGAERRDFWRRVASPKLISPGWYLLIALIFPALAGVGVALDALVSGEAPALTVLAQLAANPLTLIPMLLLGISTGPLAEELGWRGFALDRLQARTGLLAASLVLGVIWALWHLPLFLIRGTPQYDMGLGSAQFWLFLAIGVPASILMTRAYNCNGRSILSAILLHWMLNLTMNLAYPLSERALTYLIVLMLAAALGVAALSGRAKGATE